MTAGQTRWSSQDREAKDTSFPVIPANDYVLIIRPNKAEVRSSTTPHEEGHRFAGHDKLPYVGGIRFEVEDVTTGDGRPRSVWKDFYMHADPDKNGGPSMVDRADGLMGLIEATGSKGVDFGLQVQESTGRNYVDPVDVVEWAKSLDGMRVGGHVGIEKGKGEYKGKDKNIITRFWPLENAERAAADETPAEETQEAAAEEEVEQEAAPAIPPPRKPAAPAKPVAKPATKAPAKPAAKPGKKK